jgi:sialate O-acetylesterase
MEKIKNFKILLVIPFMISFLLSTILVSGQIKLPDILSSNMVIQRGIDANVWGTASSNEKISVSFRGTIIKTKADKTGKWNVKIPAGEAGGPFELVIAGNNTITLENIMVGDVWVCSGQSNMEWPLKQAANGDHEVKKSNYKNIRLFQVQKNVSPVPLDNTGEAQWEECNPKTSADFSAVGYFFGRKIHTETGVPIGLINSNWGGTIVETWTSEQGLKNDDLSLKWLEGLKSYDAEAMAQKLKTIFTNYREELKKVEQPEWKHEFINPDYDDSNWDEIELPGLWESNHGYESFDGIVWHRYSFEIPKTFDFNKSVISLCMIDDTDITWINGKRIGETFNKYNFPRIYEIPSSVLKYGKNTIVVRVEDYVGGGGIYGLKSNLNISDGSNLIDLSGKWKIKKDPLPTPPNPLVLSESALQPNQYPTLLYNGMINPLINFGIKGVIWYQGESNADGMSQALRYEKQLKSMILDWRKKWGNENLYFNQVQLANYRGESQSAQNNDIWPFLREAQFKALELPNTGMACIIDIGDPNDIHPRNKVDVGERLALNVLRDVFGKMIIAHGPRYTDARLEGNRALITFSEVGAGLKSTNKYGYINGFSVAGKDKVFHFAKASFSSSNSVVVYSDEVEKIESVRFLWADNPGEINLYNSSGLPAEPFRTDNW